MRNAYVLSELANILGQQESRESKALQIAKMIREAGSYRWVGVYDVDNQNGLVLNLAWSGPSAPVYPTFSITKGLTSRAIAGKRTVNVGDVATDSDYLIALGTTVSEIIVPIVDESKSNVIGTIDVESEQRNAFDAETQAWLEQCAVTLKPFWMSKVYWR